jgi:hypothetical protein
MAASSKFWDNIVKATPLQLIGCDSDLHFYTLMGMFCLVQKTTHRNGRQFASRFHNTTYCLLNTDYRLRSARFTTRQCIQLLQDGLQRLQFRAVGGPVAVALGFLGGFKVAVGCLD